MLTPVAGRGAAMTPEREQELRSLDFVAETALRELFAEIDAVRSRAVRAEAERDEALRKLECKWGACKNCGGQVWQVWLDEPVLAGQEGKT